MENLTKMFQGKKRTRRDLGQGLTFTEIKLKDNRSERAIRRELSNLIKSGQIVKAKEKRSVYKYL